MKYDRQGCGLDLDILVLFVDINDLTVNMIVYCVT